jgi:hypothetical protein
MQGKQSFIKGTSNAAAIAANGSWDVAILQADRAQFENDFNSLIVLNQGTDAISLTLDGATTAQANITANNGSFVISPEDNQIYNYIRITNLTANEIAIGKIKVTYGRG